MLTSTVPLFLTRVIRQFGEKRLSLLESHVVYPTVNGSVVLKTLTSGGAKGRRMKQRLARDGSFAVHYWANSWVRNLAGELHNPLPYETPGFCFFAGWDSWGQDIRNVGRDIRVLVRECKNDPDALGFEHRRLFEKRASGSFPLVPDEKRRSQRGTIRKGGGTAPGAPSHCAMALYFAIQASRERPVSGHGQVRDSVENGGGRPPATRSHDAE